MSASAVVLRNLKMFTREDTLLEDLEDIAGGDAPINQTKSARKRNKNRRTKKEAQNITFGMCNNDVGDEEFSHRNLAADSASVHWTHTTNYRLAVTAKDSHSSVSSSNVIVLDNIADNRPELTSFKSLENDKRPPNSYAAAVSGQTSREVNNSDFLTTFELEPKLLVEPDMSSLRRSSSLNSLRPIVLGEGFTAATKKEIGIQVSDMSTGIISDAKRSVKVKGQQNRGTMTNTKRNDISKGVTAKLCCNDEKKAAVEFLGEHFSFENTLAKTVSLLGITFVDCDDGLPFSNE